MLQNRKFEGDSPYISFYISSKLSRGWMERGSSYKQPGHGAGSPREGSVVLAAHVCSHGLGF